MPKVRVRLSGSPFLWRLPRLLANSYTESLNTCANRCQKTRLSDIRSLHIPLHSSFRQMDRFTSALICLTSPGILPFRAAVVVRFTDLLLHAFDISSLSFVHCQRFMLRTEHPCELNEPHLLHTQQQRSPTCTTIIVWYRFVMHSSRRSVSL
jgi:hypothetical protein